ncbi:hypothetical protein [Streptantibioticus cattleyicolor]|nr:hypothetical protein [Streptantibioticus cattleyicolor]
MSDHHVPRARRVAVNPAGAHDASAFALPAAALPSLTPEEWARATFEGAPGPLRQVLRAGWTAGLGLRLGPGSSPRHVLGWPITGSGADAVTLEARSPLLTARNVVTVEGSRLVWATFVWFEKPAGRAVWSAAAPVHHRTVPYLLARAARRRAPTPGSRLSRP